MGLTTFFIFGILFGCFVPILLNLAIRFRELAPDPVEVQLRAERYRLAYEIIDNTVKMFQRIPQNDENWPAPVVFREIGQNIANSVSYMQLSNEKAIQDFTKKGKEFSNKLYELGNQCNSYARDQELGCAKIRNSIALVGEAYKSGNLEHFIENAKKLIYIARKARDQTQELHQEVQNVITHGKVVRESITTVAAVGGYEIPNIDSQIANIKGLSSFRYWWNEDRYNDQLNSLRSSREYISHINMISSTMVAELNNFEKKILYPADDAILDYKAKQDYLLSELDENLKKNLPIVKPTAEEEELWNKMLMIFLTNVDTWEAARNKFLIRK